MYLTSIYGIPKEVCQSTTLENKEFFSQLEASRLVLWNTGLVLLVLLVGVLAPALSPNCSHSDPPSCKYV